MAMCDKENVSINVTSATPSTPAPAQMRKGKKAAATPATTLPGASPWSQTPAFSVSAGFDDSVCAWTIVEHNTFIHITTVAEETPPSTPLARPSRACSKLSMTEPRDFKPPADADIDVALGTPSRLPWARNGGGGTWGPTPESSPFPIQTCLAFLMQAPIPRTISLSDAILTGLAAPAPALPFGSSSEQASASGSGSAWGRPPQHLRIFDFLPAADHGTAFAADQASSSSAACASASASASAVAGGELSVAASMSTSTRRRTRRSQRSSARRRATVGRPRAATEGDEAGCDDDIEEEEDDHILPQRLTFADA